VLSRTVLPLFHWGKLLLYLLYSFRLIWVYCYPPHLTKDKLFRSTRRFASSKTVNIVNQCKNIKCILTVCFTYSDVTITSSFLFGYRLLHYHLPLSYTVKMCYKSHPSPSTGLFLPFHGWRWGVCVPSHVPKVNVLLMLSSIVRYGHPISSPELDLMVNRSIKRSTHSSVKLPPVVTVICVLSLTAILWWQEALGHRWGPVSGTSHILMATYRAAINYTFSHIAMWPTRSHSWGWRESGMEWCILSTLMGYVSLAAIAELFCKPPTHTHTTYIGPGSVLGHSEHTHCSQEIEAALSTGPWGVPPTMASRHWGTQETGYGSSIWCQAHGRKPDILNQSEDIQTLKQKVLLFPTPGLDV